MNKSENVLDLSWETIFKIALSIIFFYLLFQVKDILVWFIFALIISILFNPMIEFLIKFKIPRSLATAIVYLSFFGISSVVIYSVLSVLITELDQFSRILPFYFRELSPVLRDLGIHAFEDIENFVVAIRGSLREMTTALFSFSFAIFGGLFTTFFVLTMSFFLSIEGKVVDRAILLIFPKKYEDYAVKLWGRSQKKVSSWFFTRIISCLFVGAATYISCVILRIDYPLSLGLIAGIFNFIPYIGSLIAGILIFMIAAMDGLTKALFISSIFLIIQLIESIVLIPVLSQKFIGLSPVLVILALAIGGALWGFLGALLAIPLVGIIFEFLKEYLDRRKQESLVNTSV
ncbi:MAG: AI-2E family transporter [Candidatus Nealsonbacteria bacterium]|nr:AI-2E family transporter [Candidatus Nealsonbacteria bacterium]